MSEYFKKQGRVWVQAFPYHGVDIEVLIMGGVRHTLGASSYAPGCAMRFCRDNWWQLTEKVKTIVMRDVLEWLGDSNKFLSPGQTKNPYETEWREFLRWGFKTAPEAAKVAASQLEWKRKDMHGVDEFMAVLVTCKKCGGEMHRGKAIQQTFTGTPDFGEVVTMSVGGPGRLIDCMKCKDCGWSTT